MAGRVAVLEGIGAPSCRRGYRTPDPSPTRGCLDLRATDGIKQWALNEDHGKVIVPQGHGLDSEDEVSTPRGHMSSPSPTRRGCVNLAGGKDMLRQGEDGQCTQDEVSTPRGHMNNRLQLLDCKPQGGQFPAFDQETEDQVSTPRRRTQSVQWLAMPMVDAHAQAFNKEQGKRSSEFSVHSRSTMDEVCTPRGRSSTAWWSMSSESTSGGDSDTPLAEECSSEGTRQRWKTPSPERSYAQHGSGSWSSEDLDTPLAEECSSEGARERWQTPSPERSYVPRGSVPTLLMPVPPVPPMYTAPEEPYCASPAAPRPKPSAAAAPVSGTPEADQSYEGLTYTVSAGSMGHPVLCAKACKFAWKPRGCKDGPLCNRCHLCGWRRSCDAPAGGSSEAGGRAQARRSNLCRGAEQR